MMASACGKRQLIVAQRVASVPCIIGLCISSTWQITVAAPGARRELIKLRKHSKHVPQTITHSQAVECIQGHTICNVALTCRAALEAADSIDRGHLAA